VSLPNASQFLQDDIILEMRVYGVLDGQACFNVFHYVTEDNGEPVPTSSPTLFGCMQDFHTQWNAAMVPIFTDRYATLYYECLKVFSVTHVVAPSGLTSYNVNYRARNLYFPAGAPFIGGIADIVVPSFSSMTVRKFTGEVGRKWRGSMKLPPIPQSATDENKWDATALAGLETAVNTLRVFEDFGSVDSNFDGKMAVFSRSSTISDDPIDLTLGVASDVINLFPNADIGTQRSRKVGVGV